MNAALRLNLFAMALAVVIAAPATGCRTKRPDKGITLIRTGPGSNVASPSPVGPGMLPSPETLFGFEADKLAFRLNVVFFDYDSAALKAKELPKLKEVAVVLRNSPGCKVVVDGHCDERGTEEYNRSLGERRALKVREQLIKEGISGDRIFTRTYGKDVPAALGHDEAAWAQNRRGEFILLRPPGGAGARTP